MANFNFGKAKMPPQDEDQFIDTSQSYANFSNLPSSQPNFIDYNEEREKNLIKLQIDLTETLDDVRHWLNGDSPTLDKYGKRQWAINENPEYKQVNEKGLRDIMSILMNYLAKDNILSNLEEEKINIICQQISTEVNDYLFMNYNLIGLEKKKYSLIVVQTAHRIYMTLMRAKDGLERDSVTNNSVVSQNDNPFRDNQGGGIRGLINGFGGGGRRGY